MINYIHSKILFITVPKYSCSQLGGEVGFREPSQNILHDVLLFLVHEPVTDALVVDNLGLRKELLDHTDGGLGARTVSSSTEEEYRDLDRVGQREVTGWNFEVSKCCSLTGSPVTFLLVEANLGGPIVVQWAAEGAILGDI